MDSPVCGIFNIASVPWMVNIFKYKLPKTAEVSTITTKKLSLVLFAIVDAHYNVINEDVGCQGQFLTVEFSKLLVFTK